MASSSTTATSSVSQQQPLVGSPSIQSESSKEQDEPVIPMPEEPRSESDLSDRNEEQEQVPIPQAENQAAPPVDFLECDLCPAVYKLPKPLAQLFQGLFVKAVTGLIEAIRMNDCEIQTKAFMALPVLLHGVAGQREVRRAKRMLSDVEQSANLYMAILQEAKRLKSHRRDLPERRGENVRLPRRRIVELVEAGLPGKAVARLEGHLQGGIVELNAETIARVLELHPTSFARIPMANPVPELEVAPISATELAESLDNAPRLSASGQSGWTYDLIREVMQSDAARTIAAELLTLMANGKMPDDRAWLVSRLVLLPKPAGGVRPLAVGEAWTRLLGRILSKRTTATASRLLAPVQFGIGVKGGVEVVSHIVQAASKAVLAGDNLVIQSVDFANAFNSVSRAVIHHELATHIPQLIPYLRWAYGGPAPLCMGVDHVVDATSGVRQGDPLGPLLFSMALQPTLLHVKQLHPNVDIVAYLDDVFLLGERLDVSEAFDFLKQQAEHIGLRVNEHKSHLFAEGSSDCFTAVGAPIGQTHDVDAELQQELQAKAAVTEQILDFGPRHAYAMVKACVNARPMFWARTCAPDRGVAAFERFDQAIDDALIALSGGSDHHLTEGGKAIRHLPQAMGGLGLRRFSVIRNLCWAASFAVAAPHVQRLRSLSGKQAVDESLTSLRQTITESLDPNGPQVLEAEIAVTQKQMMQRSDQVIWGELLTSYQDKPAIQAWLRSCACADSVTWLEHASLKTHDREFHTDLLRTCLRMRLLQNFLPLAAGQQQFSCTCDFNCEQSIELAVHVVGCGKYSQLRTARHDAIRGHLVKGLQSLHLGAHINTEAMIAGPIRKRSDVRWVRGAEVVHFDLSVVSPSSGHALAKDSHLQHQIASGLGEEIKRREYDAPLRAANLQLSVLKPVVFETSGRPGTEASKISQWFAEKTRAAGLTSDGKAAATFLSNAAVEIWLYNGKILNSLVRALRA